MSQLPNSEPVKVQFSQRKIGVKPSDILILLGESRQLLTERFEVCDHPDDDTIVTPISWVTHKSEHRRAFGHIGMSYGVFVL